MVIPNDGGGPRERPDKPDKPDKPKPEKPGKPDSQRPERPDRDLHDHADKDSAKEKAEKEAAARAREIKTATEINERTKERTKVSDSSANRSIKSGETKTSDKLEGKAGSSAGSQSSLEKRSNFDTPALDQRSSTEKQDALQAILDNRHQEAVSFCAKNGDRKPTKDALRDFCVEKLGAKNAAECTYESKIRDNGFQDCKIGVRGSEGSIEYTRGFDDNGKFESTVTITDKNGKSGAIPAGTESDKAKTREAPQTVELRPVYIEPPKVKSTTTQHTKIGVDHPLPPRPDPPVAKVPAGPKAPLEQPWEKLPKAPIVNFENPDKDQPEKKKTSPFNNAENKPDVEKTPPSRSEQGNGPVGDRRFPEPHEKQPPDISLGTDAGDIALETAAEIAKGVLKGVFTFKVPTNAKQALAVINLVMGGAMMLPILTLGALEKSPLSKPKSAQELKQFKEQMKQLKELSTLQGLLKDTVVKAGKEIMKPSAPPDQLEEKSRKAIPHKSFETDQNMTGPSPSRNHG